MLATKTKKSLIPTITSTPITNSNAAEIASAATEKAIKIATSHSTSIALHQCILDGRFKQIKYLLKLGSKVNVKDIYGRTCLMLASLCDHEDYGIKLAKLLIKYGADLNTQDYMGRSAVCIACSEKRDKLTELFLEKHSTSIDFRQKDNDGNILLNFAAMHGTTKAVRLIVEKMNNMHISVDQRNNLGYTALLLAIKHKNYEIAYILLTEGNASPFLKDNELFYNAIEWIFQNNTNNDNINLLSTSIKNLTASTNKLTNSFITSKSSKQSIKSSTINEHTSAKPSTAPSLNELQHEFQLVKSSTFVSQSSASSARQVNYKTWYNIPNPYYDLPDMNGSKCDHVNYANHSIDLHRSNYTPAIFTPRTPHVNSSRNRVQRPPPPSTSALQSAISQHPPTLLLNQDPLEYSTYDLDYNYNGENDILFRLMEKLQEKMINSQLINAKNMSTPGSSAKRELNTPYKAPIEDNKEAELTQPIATLKPTLAMSQSLNINDRMPTFLTTSARSIASSQHSQQTVQTPLRNKRLLQQLLSQQPNMTPADISGAMTAKLLALQPSSKTAIKDEIHNIFEHYSGSHFRSSPDDQYSSSTSFSKFGNNFKKLSKHEQSHLISIDLNKKPNKGIIQKFNSSPLPKISGLNKENRVKEVTFNLD